eukprot:403372837
MSTKRQSMANLPPKGNVSKVQSKNLVDCIQWQSQSKQAPTKKVLKIQNQNNSYYKNDSNNKKQAQQFALQLQELEEKRKNIVDYLIKSKYTVKTQQTENVPSQNECLNNSKIGFNPTPPFGVNRSRIIDNALSSRVLNLDHKYYQTQEFKTETPTNFKSRKSHPKQQQTLIDELNQSSLSKNKIENNQRSMSKTKQQTYDKVHKSNFKIFYSLQELENTEAQRPCIKLQSNFANYNTKLKAKVVSPQDKGNFYIGNNSQLLRLDRSIYKMSPMNQSHLVKKMRDYTSQICGLSGSTEKAPIQSSQLSPAQTKAKMQKFQLMSVEYENLGHQSNNTSEAYQSRRNSLMPENQRDSLMCAATLGLRGVNNIISSRSTSGSRGRATKMDKNKIQDSQSTPNHTSYDSNHPHHQVLKFLTNYFQEFRQTHEMLSHSDNKLLCQTDSLQPITMKFLLGQIFSSSVSNIFGVAMGHPLDTVKNASFSRKNWNNLMYTSVHTGRRDVRLVQGNSFSNRCFCSIQHYVSYKNFQLIVSVFVTNEISKRKLQQYDFSDKNMGLVTGAVGGTLGLFMLVPTEVLKCNIQVNTGKFISYKEFIPIIYEKKGIKGFYQGYWATFWRDVPGWAIYFYSYEALKNYFYKNHLSKSKINESQFKRQEFFMRLFCGGMAGVNSWLLCFPFDVVKTHIQVSILSEQPVETRMRKVILNIYRQKGIRHFYVGMLANLIRTFPVDAIILASFDYINEWLEKVY